jgi:hypothetical protein
MSDEFEGPFADPSILFFHKDPEEKRPRIEGAQPPPESVRVPRLVGSREPQPEALEYQLLKFPWEPWSQGTETQSLARQYADWLNRTGAARLTEFRSLLEQAGAPVQEPAEVAALGTWVQDWFAILAKPYVAQGFIDRHSTSRLGWVWAARSPRSQGYSRSVDALTGSLAHDLALLIADAARRERPGITWQPVFDTSRGHFVVTIDGDPNFGLIEYLVEFLMQSVATPRGARGRELRNWFSLTLQRCVERAVHGPPVTRVFDAFPDVQSDLAYPRLTISRPKRSDPPAPDALVAAAEKFRQAGWFDSVKFSSADVARAAQNAWRTFEGEDIPAEPAEIYWRLLLLDGGRTWSEDVDAGIQPGDGVYEAIAESLSHAGVKAIRGLYDADEDWASTPGDLSLALPAQRGKPKILIPAPAPYISAALFTGLNELLPDDGPRLWFFDHGPPIGIVTRATEAERDALELLTGIRLDRDPPAWWAALAPIPEYRAASKPDRAPAQPAKPAKAPLTPRHATRASRVDAAGGKGDAEGVPTAQQAFAHMMRNLIAPALRDLGFKGSPTRGFSFANGDYVGDFWTQKSRYSTKAEVVFWVHLSAAHQRTNSVYWTTQLHALIPGNDSFGRWTLRADEQVEPVADHLLGVFRSYGWPAIQAAVDSPGYPPDPGITWARSFPAEPSPAGRGASGPNLGPLTWLVHRATHQDDVFAELADSDEIVRMDAALEIGLTALGDARAVPALLNRLEFDPSASVRERAALALGPVGDRPEVREAFRAAAAEDEDVQVRWAARYGIRLAANPASRDQSD